MGIYAGSNAGPIGSATVTLQLILLTNMKTGLNNQQVLANLRQR